MRINRKKPFLSQAAAIAMAATLLMAAAAAAQETPAIATGEAARPPGDFEALAPALDDVDGDVRFNAIRRLASTRDVRAIGPLQKALGDEREENRRAAAPGVRFHA